MYICIRVYICIQYMWIYIYILHNTWSPLVSCPLLSPIFTLLLVSLLSSNLFFCISAFLFSPLPVSPFLSSLFAPSPYLSSPLHCPPPLWLPMFLSYLLFSLLFPPLLSPRVLFFPSFPLPPPILLISFYPFLPCFLHLFSPLGVVLFSSLADDVVWRPGADAKWRVFPSQ